MQETSSSQSPAGSPCPMRWIKWERLVNCEELFWITSCVLAVFFKCSLQQRCITYFNQWKNKHPLQHEVQLSILSPDLTGPSGSIWHGHSLPSAWHTFFTSVPGLHILPVFPHPQGCSFADFFSSIKWGEVQYPPYGLQWELNAERLGKCLTHSTMSVLAIIFYYYFLTY